MGRSEGVFRDGCGQAKSVVTDNTRSTYPEDTSSPKFPSSPATDHVLGALINSLHISAHDSTSEQPTGRDTVRDEVQMNSVTCPRLHSLYVVS